MKLFERHYKTHKKISFIQNIKHTKSYSDIKNS